MEIKPHENFERFQCGEVQPPMEVEPHGTSDLTRLFRSAISEIFSDTNESNMFASICLRYQ